MSQRIRTLVRVEGIVQGVGFRPFVYTLATGLGLGGLVGNDLHGVFAEVEGPPETVDEFLAALRRDAPPLASIERITTKSLRPNGSASFSIAPSESGDVRKALVSADSATCADCLAELRDPADRRFGYPFVNCTNCGPRFTIIRDVPYDRPLTTMSNFDMCELCAVEYHDPANRRFHAQPVCCPACGPALRLIDRTGTPLAASPPPGPARPGTPLAVSPPPGSTRPGTPPAGTTLPGSPTTDSASPGTLSSPPRSSTLPGPTPPGSPIAVAAAMLLRGDLLAVKGLGGYHLAADAASDAATAALRARKHREDKPFAVMAADLAQARLLCEVDETAAALLTSRRRPIVLLPVRPDAALARSVAPANRQLGVMLPYTPLHYLLLSEIGRPIVLTSGNISDEPIAHTDAEALERLRGIADAFLTHDRAIHIRTDDSVVRAFGGRESVVRRSRGYAPEPVTVRTGFRRHVLACGAELKNTFCLARDDHAFVSQHIGDLENAATLRSFIEGIEHFSRLFDIQPAVIAHDLHPEYLSTKYAEDLVAASEGDIDLAGVQHHHAHIASCLADNGADGPVIGVAFDGTGYGTDGTIWGGEFLIAGLAGFERAGYLAPVPMPGGAAAIRQPWRMAAVYLDAAYPGGTPETLDVARRNERQWTDVLTMARRGINAPLTSSAGRLFDAVAAVLGIRDSINYEGQAAVELEQLADPDERSSYRATISPADQHQTGGQSGQSPPSGDRRTGTPASPQVTGGSVPLQVAGSDLVRAVADDLAAGVDRSVIAARFHNGVVALIEDCCLTLRERHGLNTVALSGGVFQNLLLLHGVVGRLEAHGFDVLLHSRVPCNDGGISLGQAVVAAARDWQR